jgi:uracil phosphoribosyltransferase
MLIMLLVAMIPTGGYYWTDPGYYLFTGAYTTPAPSDYAICHLNPTENYEALTFSTMVISVLLLALGFIHRVIRMHRTLSVSVLGVFRTFCSEKARNVLRRTYTTMGMETSGLTLKRLFLWRPLLALFLTARALLDLWNSMFIEVWSV